MPDINECDGDPCENGGTCNDAVNGFTCTCADGWTSTLCDSGKHLLSVIITTFLLYIEDLILYISLVDVISPSLSKTYYLS